MTRALKRFAFLPMALDAHCTVSCHFAKCHFHPMWCVLLLHGKAILHVWLSRGRLGIAITGQHSVVQTCLLPEAECSIAHCVFIIGTIMKSNIITQLYVYHVLYCIFILSYSSTLTIELYLCLRGRPCVRNCCRKGGKGHSNHSSCLTKMSIALMTRKNYFPILICQD